MYKTSPEGRKFIKSKEDLKLKAYKPHKDDVWTIGYGTTKDVKPGMVITQIEAENLFDRDIAEFEAAVNKLITVPVTQGEFDALVSFTYNVGSGKAGLGGSTLRRKLNAGDKMGAADEFLRWIFSAGKVLHGLAIRRADERNMFLGLTKVPITTEPKQSKSFLSRIFG